MQSVEVLRKGVDGCLSLARAAASGDVAGGAKNLTRGVVADARLGLLGARGLFPPGLAKKLGEATALTRLVSARSFSGVQPKPMVAALTSSDAMAKRSLDVLTAPLFWFQIFEATRVA